MHVSKAKQAAHASLPILAQVYANNAKQITILVTHKSAAIIPTAYPA